VDILVRPCVIQESDILLPTKNIASGNRQSGYRNLLRTQSSWRLARLDGRSRRGRSLQAVTRDSAPRIDSACYRRYRLQKFCGSLKSAPGILLEQYLKEKDGRLWNSLQQVERQRCVLMLVDHLARGTLEHHMAGHHFPEHRSQRVEVRTDVHADADELF